MWEILSPFLVLWNRKEVGKHWWLSWEPVWPEEFFTHLLPIMLGGHFKGASGRVMMPKRGWKLQQQPQKLKKALDQGQGKGWQMGWQWAEFWVQWVMLFLLSYATGNTLLVCVCAVRLWLLLHNCTGRFFLVRWQRGSWASLWFAGTEWRAESMNRTKCYSRQKHQLEAVRAWKRESFPLLTWRGTGSPFTGWHVMCCRSFCPGFRCLKDRA